MSGIAQSGCSSTMASLLCQSCGRQCLDFEVLKCGHCICSSCPSIYLNTGTSPCTVCKSGQHRNKLRVVSEAFLRKFDELFNAKPSNSTENDYYCCICQFRKVNVLATHQCLDCSDTLCQACSSGHIASRVTHAHKVVPISDVLDGTHCLKVAPQALFRCPEHLQEMFVFFCETCNKLICALCFTQQHKKHTVETTDALTKKYQKEILGASAKLKELFSEAKTKVLLQDLEKGKRNTKDLKTGMLNDIHSRCESLINFVLAEEKKATSRVLEFYDSQLSDIDTLEDIVHTTSDVAADFIPLLKSIEEDEDPVRFMMLYEDVKKCLEQFTIVETEMDRRSEDLKDELHLEVSNAIHLELPFRIKEERARSSDSKDPIQPMETQVCGLDNAHEATGANQPLKLVQGLQVKLPVTVVGSEKETDRLSFVGDNKKSSSLEDVHTPSKDKADINVKCMVECFKITESLTITGPFAEGLKKGTASSETNLLISRTNPNIPLPSPTLSYTSWADEVDFVERRTQNDKDSKKITKLRHDPSISPIEIKWISKTKINCKVFDDQKFPDIKALRTFGDSDAKIVISDNANKKIRMISEKGRHFRMSCVRGTDEIPLHSIASLKTVIAFVSGSRICIVDKNLQRLKTIEMVDIPPPTDVTFMPLCKYADSLFIVGNLPGNKTRIYNINGTMCCEQPAPVKGTIVAISLDNHDRLLYSSWHQPGAVYLVKKTGQCLRTFRPSEVDHWYPQGTCVDKMDNVYVADPIPGRILAFNPNGSQISTLSLTESLITPRCLTWTTDGFLYVAGSNSQLIMYKVEAVPIH